MDTKITFHQEVDICQTSFSNELYTMTDNFTGPSRISTYLRCAALPLPACLHAICADLSMGIRKKPLTKGKQTIHII